MNAFADERGAKLPSLDTVHALCAQISDRTTRRIITTKPNAQEVDINNDGVLEEIRWCDGGTMNVACIEYLNQQGKQLKIDKQGFEWKDYWTYSEQSFQYGARTFRLYGDPSHVTYTTPSNKEFVVCDFRTHVMEETTHSDYGRFYCDDVRTRGSRIYRPFAPSETTRITHEKLHAFVGNRSTSATGQGWLNIDNDEMDKPELLMEVEYTSGAGRGCGTRFYLLLSDDGTSIATNALQETLLELQNFAKGAERHPAGCVGSENSILYANRHSGLGKRNLGVIFDIAISPTVREVRTIKGVSINSGERTLKIDKECQFTKTKFAEIRSFYPFETGIGVDLEP